MPYANIKGADEPLHPRCLISTFVVPCLDNIILLLAIAEISRLLLVSVVEQACLSHTWSKPPKTRFLMMWLIYFLSLNQSVILPISVFRNSLLRIWISLAVTWSTGLGSHISHR